MRHIPSSWRLSLAACAALLLVSFGRPADASFIAYVIPAGTSGNQTHGGALGMEFDLNKQIIVTRLGVFDSGSNGLAVPISVRLYDRTNTTTPLATLSFTPADAGTLIGGSRFKDLPTPLSLMPGFQGTIVADGYGATEPNGNSFLGVPVWTTDSGGGVISFVGLSRWDGAAGVYPNNLDGGPANRYAAGTFEANLPEPATLTVLALGGLAAFLRRRRGR